MCLHVWPIRSLDTDKGQATESEPKEQEKLSWTFSPAAAHLSLKHTAQSDASAY